MKNTREVMKMVHNIKMQNIEADPRDQTITDPFNLTDDEFAAFCAGDSPLSKAVDQFDAEQQIKGLLTRENPTYSMKEFSTFLQDAREDSPEAQGASEASDDSAVGDGRP